MRDRVCFYTETFLKKSSVIFISLCVVFAAIVFSCNPPSSTKSPEPLTTGNQSCYFPFLYNGKNYTDCAPYQSYSFCATTCDYPKDKKWTKCKYLLSELKLPGCSNLRSAHHSSEPALVPSKTSNNTCVFPFQYKGKCYTDCTSADSVGGRIWCGTQISYGAQGKGYRYCSYKLTFLKEPGCSGLPNSTAVSEPWTYTASTSVSNEKCHFPFVYKKKCYTKCAPGSGTRTWCSLDKVYNSRYAYCMYNTENSTVETSANPKRGFYRLIPSGVSGQVLGLSATETVGGSSYTRAVLKPSQNNNGTVFELLPQSSVSAGGNRLYFVRLARSLCSAASSTRRALSYSTTKVVLSTKDEKGEFWLFKDVGGGKFEIIWYSASSTWFMMMDGSTSGSGASLSKTKKVSWSLKSVDYGDPELNNLCITTTTTSTTTTTTTTTTATTSTTAFPTTTTTSNATSTRSATTTAPVVTGLTNPYTINVGLLLAGVFGALGGTVVLAFIIICVIRALQNPKVIDTDETDPVVSRSKEPPPKGQWRYNVLLNRWILRSPADSGISSLPPVISDKSTMEMSSVRS